jgi:hypothetical protein
MGSFFERRLSPELVAKLERGGDFAELIPAVIGANLDVHIREDSLHVYSGRSRVLNIERGVFGYSACIHEKYVVDVRLPSALNERGEYRYYKITRPFVEEYVQLMHKIKENAAKVGKPEGDVEHQMIRGSVGVGSPMVLVDRQVQVHGVSKRADMVGVMPLDSEWEEGRLVLVELKQGEDKTIPKAADQIHQYFGILTEAGKLREEVRKSYQDVVEQKRRLGILPDWVRFPRKVVEVGCLVVLHGYNKKSVYLDRLLAAIRQGHPPTWLVMLPEGFYVLPPQGKWKIL